MELGQARRTMRLGSTLTLVAVALLVAGGASAQTVWYVDDDSCPGPGTGTAVDPFCKVQDGIAAALDGDTVLVLPGTYLETIDFLGKAIHVRSDGDGLPATYDLDPDGTVLDGVGAGSVVTFASGEGLDSTLEGLTITGGLAEVAGGGVYCDGASPSLARNVIRSNDAPGSITGLGVGGGLFLRNSNARITDNRIEQNTARRYCVMSACWGTGDGGALYCEGSSPWIARNTFWLNEAKGTYPRGGAIFLRNSDAQIEDNLFESNAATGSGGWGYSSQGAGGAIFSGYSSPTIRRNMILTNSAFGSCFDDCAWLAVGGGICVVGPGSVLLEDNVILGNRAEGGAGGGLYVVNGDVVAVRRTTFSGNDAYRGGGVCGEYEGRCAIEGSVLWGNSAWVANELALNFGSTIDVAHSDVQGGPAAASVGEECRLSWGSGAIDADPLFVDAASGDYRLQPGSPCIDAGDPADLPTGQDLAGNPRLLDGDLDRTPVIDMGAYEFDNVHLAISGSATPGGTLVLDTEGTAGLFVLLFLGVAPGEFFHPLYGSFFLDPLSRWRVVPWGSIPSSVPVPLDPRLPTPLYLVLQEVAFDPTNLAGNASNPVAVTIE